MLARSGRADDAVAGAVATRSAQRPRCPTCPIRHGSEALPRTDSRRPSPPPVNEWPCQYGDGLGGLASSGPPSGVGASGDATAVPCRAERSATPCATPATRRRAGSRRADPVDGAAGASAGASTRPIAAEGPGSQGQPLGVRGTSDRSIGELRSAPSAYGILSRVQRQNQPRGRPFGLWRSTGLPALSGRARALPEPGSPLQETSLSENASELALVGFEPAGACSLDPSAKGGVRFSLNAHH